MINSVCTKLAIPQLIPTTKSSIHYRICVGHASGCSVAGHRCSAIIAVADHSPECSSSTVLPATSSSTLSLHDTQAPTVLCLVVHDDMGIAAASGVASYEARAPLDFQI